MLRVGCLLLFLTTCACGSKTGLFAPVTDDDDAGTRPDASDRPDARDGCVPENEVCNERDDDCDGVADDGISCFFLDGAPLDPTPTNACGADWYSYNFPDSESANPSPDIRRSGEVVLAVQAGAGCAGAHVGIIADLPNDGSGGQLDGSFSVTPAGSGAGIVVSDEPNECFFDPAAGVGGCNWVWQTCCTDGVLLGPFFGDACIDLRLENHAGLSQLVILDGITEIPRALPATLELCTRFKPAVP